METNVNEESEGGLRISVDLNIDGDWREDPLKLLFGLAKGMQSLGRWQQKGVREARAQGKSWEAIGSALGMSRQAAWERFRDLTEADGGD